MHPSPEIAQALGGRRIVVTGGAGFIGSHLVGALVAHSADVVVIDDLSNGVRANLDHAGDAVTFIEGSILDQRALDEAMDGASIVYHQAAMSSVPRSVDEPMRYHEVNCNGTLRVLEQARRRGVSRVIYAASSSAYGDQPQSPKVETMLPDPLSPYAAAKFAGEHLVRCYAHCYGMSAISLRYFNIFGPRQRPDSPYAAVIPRFAEAMLSGRPVTIYGDGSQTRDFTHVANAVYANLLAGATEADLTGQVVNIACGDSASVIELARRMEELLAVTARIEHAPPRTGEVMHSRASIDRARELIGYEPVMAFEDGLADAVAHYARRFTESGR